MFHTYLLSSFSLSLLLLLLLLLFLHDFPSLFPPFLQFIQLCCCLLLLLLGPQLCFFNICSPFQIGAAGKEMQRKVIHYGISLPGQSCPLPCAHHQHESLALRDTALSDLIRIPKGAPFPFAASKEGVSHVLVCPGAAPPCLRTQASSSFKRLQ